jgi:hypothetical protein
MFSSLPSNNLAPGHILKSSIKKQDQQVQVAHACNPSYSGGRVQEDRTSKWAQANSWWDPVVKKPYTKRASGVAQGIRDRIILRETLADWSAFPRWPRWLGWKWYNVGKWLKKLQVFSSLHYTFHVWVHCGDLAGVCICNSEVQN